MSGHLAEAGGACNNAHSLPQLWHERAVARRLNASSCSFGDGVCSWSTEERPWCGTVGGFLFHVYPVPGAGQGSAAFRSLMAWLVRHPLHTQNASMACVLVPELDTLQVSNTPGEGDLRVTELLARHELWGGSGKGNALFHFGDHEPMFETGLAATAKSSLVGTWEGSAQVLEVRDGAAPGEHNPALGIMRARYDVAMPLTFYRCGAEPYKHLSVPAHTPTAAERSTLAVFKGAKYDAHAGHPSAARSALWEVAQAHSDVTVALTCWQSASDCGSLERRPLHSSSDSRCGTWQAEAESVDYSELLLASRFAFVVAGEGAHSYRVLEALAHGSVPVVLRWAALPLSGPGGVDWTRLAVLWQDTSVAGLGRLVEHLRRIPPRRVEQLRRAGERVFRRHFSHAERHVAGVVSMWRAGFLAASAATQGVLHAPRAGVSPWAPSAGVALGVPIHNHPLATSFQVDTAVWRAKGVFASFIFSVDDFHNILTQTLSGGWGSVAGTAYHSVSGDLPGNGEGREELRRLLHEAYVAATQGRHLLAARRVLQWLGFGSWADVLGSDGGQSRGILVPAGFSSGHQGSVGGNDCLALSVVPSGRHVELYPTAAAAALLMVSELYGHASHWRDSLTAAQLAAAFILRAVALKGKEVMEETTRIPFANLRERLLASLYRSRRQWLANEQGNLGTFHGPGSLASAPEAFFTAETRRRWHTNFAAWKRLSDGLPLQSPPELGTVPGPGPLPVCTSGSGHAVRSASGGSVRFTTSGAAALLPRFAVVSLCAYNESVTPLTGLTRRNRAAYTSHHGYANRFHTEVRDETRPPAWSKVRLVLDALHEREEGACSSCYAHDWVVWLDCDTFVMNGSIPLESIVWGASVGWQVKRGVPLSESDMANMAGGGGVVPDLILAEDGAILNTGVFFVHNTAWTRRVLEEVWAGSSTYPAGWENELGGQKGVHEAADRGNGFISHTWWEQAALFMSVVLGRRAEEFEQRVAWVPQVWVNSYPPSIAQQLSPVMAHNPPHASYEEGDWVVSFSGCKSLLGGQEACNAAFREYAGSMLQ